jgi:hypothetical protein
MLLMERPRRARPHIYHEMPAGEIEMKSHMHGEQYALKHEARDDGS